jgi:hypothetical protein
VLNCAMVWAISDVPLLARPSSVLSLFVVLSSDVDVLKQICLIVCLRAEVRHMFGFRALVFIWP